MRATYERLAARRAASPTLAALSGEVAGATGLLSTDGSTTLGEVLRLAEAFALTAASRVLDAGCGPAAPARALARATGCRVVGFDLVPARLARARAPAEAATPAVRLAAVAADATRGLPFRPAAFDAALVTDMIIHVAAKRALLSEIAGALRPGGGLAIISTVGDLTPEQLAAAGDPGAWFLTTREALAGLVAGAGFDVEVAEDRGEHLRRLHRARLAAMERRREALERELGPDEAATVVGRQQALAGLAGAGRLSSCLIVARRREPTSEQEGGRR